MRKEASLVIFPILLVGVLTFSFACNLLPTPGKSESSANIENGQSEGSKVMSGSLNLNPQYIRVSISSNGEQGDDDSYYPSISGDGRYITFHTEATNLTPGGPGLSPKGSGQAVVVHDLRQKRTILASVPLGDSGGYGDVPSISADGRYVAFESESSAFNKSDQFGQKNIFVADITNHTCKIISSDKPYIHPAGGQQPNISADGRYVVFESIGIFPVNEDYAGKEFASTFNNIYVRDLQNNSISLVSVGWGGHKSDGQSCDGKISADGRYVTFRSDASNLISTDDLNYHHQDIFIRDLQGDFLHSTKLVSIQPQGGQFQQDSMEHCISGNGGYVAFTAIYNGQICLFVRDMQTNITRQITVNPGTLRGINLGDDYGFPSMSYDGSQIVLMLTKYSVKEGVITSLNIILHNLITDSSTVIVTQNNKFLQGRMSQYRPEISADGKYIAFVSSNSDIVPGDTNGYDDVFIYRNDATLKLPAIKPPLEVPLTPSTPTSKPHILETPLQHK